MGLSLHKKMFLFLLVTLTLKSFAGENNPLTPGMPFKHFIAGRVNQRDSFSSQAVSSKSICSCQVLDLESTNHRHRNFALFAEKRNGKSMSSDLNRINKVIEKEKKHMQYFFYDKLTVVHAFTEATDCRSLYSKLKSGNKSLVMYDILNADTRR